MESSYDLSIRRKSKSTQASDGWKAYHSIYEQLPVNESRTRVLVLHSASSNTAQVSCSLEVMRLDPEPNRAYTALSYVWGDASVTKDIIVNGVSFAVTINLEFGLRQIRKSFGEVVLWVDAVSINQKDITERNQQVLLMTDIYSKAQRVIAWIGLDENGGSQALKDLGTLLENVIRYPDKLEWVRRMPKVLSVNGTYPIDTNIKIQSNDRLEKLLLFLKSPFWRRIWIVQELVLPSNLRLLCGDEFTDIPRADLFYNAIGKLSRQPLQLPKSFPYPMWRRLYECTALLTLIARLRYNRLPGKQQGTLWEGISGFLSSRGLLEFHKTSDPRDHVYGLLGLMKLDIVPDYGENMTVSDVYLEAARYCLKTKQTGNKAESLDIPYVDILCHAGIVHGNDKPKSLPHLDLPSWVPDWRLRPPARLRLKRYPESHAFPSAGGLQMHVIDHKWLRGSAVVWDTVSRTEHKTGWDLTEWDLAKEIDIGKPGDRDYPSGISRFKAFILLWVGGLDGIKASPSACDLQLDSKLFQSYEVIFFRRVVQQLHRSVFGREEIARGLVVSNGHQELYAARSRQLRYGMRCFHTERGYIGFGPLATEVGDVVCILEGHKAPVLLRRRGSHYIFVGDCDVVGIMNGEVLEAVKHSDAAITEIEIR